jgi:EAL domain-containing protein (putative c-di-GMP-specific phosphodiesterase class I)
LPITAEGIETDKVLEQLRAYGAVRGQGYLYGKSASGTDTHNWLAGEGLLAPTDANPQVKPQDDNGDQAKPSGALAAHR